MLTKKSDSGITITHEQKDEFDITSVRRNDEVLFHVGVNTNSVKRFSIN